MRRFRCPGRGLNGRFSVGSAHARGRWKIEPKGSSSRVPAFRADEPFLKVRKGLAPGCGETKGTRHMALYEHVFLVRQDVTAQQVEELTARFKGVIEANGGSVAKVEAWGVKTLTYRINKNRKAHFTLMNIDAPAAAVQEMERQMGIDEDVLRFLTIRVDALEEGPSAMLQKRDRDDRGERGERGFGGGGFGGRGDREDRPRRSREREEAPAEETF
ncbi:hypothetical protein GCM10007301_53790 [Azorhizobium oxalatiphilum]|uniref:Small ribosomal subunit protein bS6 n=2 Tax=Azorhizobium oxalatiphilum TaxID=980631 RepID=A0A917CHZ0_9HYPH|nr:hypothetical protein GCM10007301_53790 [Azorhizobium oxalatiphilum]